MCRHARRTRWVGGQTVVAGRRICICICICVSAKRLRPRLRLRNGGLWWLGVFLPSLLLFLLSWSLFRFEEGVDAPFKREV